VGLVLGERGAVRHEELRPGQRDGVGLVLGAHCGLVRKMEYVGLVLGERGAVRREELRPGQRDGVRLVLGAHLTYIHLFRVYDYCNMARRRRHYHVITLCC